MPALHRTLALSLTFLSASVFQAKAQKLVLFEQAGFPTVDSEPLPHAALAAALPGTPLIADLAKLRAGDVLKDATLLVLPYGSSFPAAAWPAIMHYLDGGGNLLVLGGQPLHVPVLGEREGAFQAESPQTSYSRLIDIRHSYAAPLGGAHARFAWKPGYGFLPSATVNAAQVFVEEGHLQGLGYLDAEDGTHLAAPVIVLDHGPGGKMAGARIVALPFDPRPGYWSSSDGTALIHAAAAYALAGSTSLQLEAQYSTLRPGELPELTAHLRSARGGCAGTLQVELSRDGRPVDHASLQLGATDTDIPLPFHAPVTQGVYTFAATWTPASAEHPQEFADNGFVVEEASALDSGDALGTHGDFLTLGDKPFLPVGTNYFTTEENGWDFSGPRNSAMWERDFADMERHNVSFVRTGVWMSPSKFVEPLTGGVNERFLRNLEAYLAAAHRHHVAVNFTFFAFSPHVNEARRQSSDTTAAPPPPNPYLDPGALEQERGYIASVVRRFGKVPWLSYDLINEPSFSNPRTIFHGNVPNGDPEEVSAWCTWLQQHYAGDLNSLADAWRTTPAQLGDWRSIPLPSSADLNPDRYGNKDGVRAYDYNLFAQDMFAGWVRQMVAAIRGAGSQQLINVGQDEGGVTNRVLNQFYATAGVAFTTNHTYWQDDALLWDSVAAKRPGLPNITGETGYQPAWNPDASWRYDELTGTAIEERKWALGFAAGSSGAMQWDWAREPDFGIERSDGSAKVWEPMMAELGDFAKKSAPYAGGLILPDVAIVLPQSLQLSVKNSQALTAQQTAVRVLYQYNRVEAYAVGEYQLDTLGTPKLILLPSAYGLTQKAWEAIEARVRAGAVLLISGPFDGDEHMHATGRERALGLDTTLMPLQQRDETLHGPAGDLPLQFGGMATTVLDRDVLPSAKDWKELTLGEGKVLFSSYPLELNTNLESIAQVYGYALKLAGVGHTYTSPVNNHGILICPTRLPHATVYALTSETETMPVSFTDKRSGKTFTGTLDAGRAALLLVTERGDLTATYNWHARR